MFPAPCLEMGLGLLSKLCQFLEWALFTHRCIFLYRFKRNVTFFPVLMMFIQRCGDPVLYNFFIHYRILAVDGQVLYVVKR